MSAAPTSDASPGTWPDLRLAGVATGTWLAAISALYLTAIEGIVLAGVAALLAAIVGIGLPRRVGSLPGRRRSGSRRYVATPERRGSLARTLSTCWSGRPRVDLSALRWAFVAAMIGATCGAAATAAHVVIRERQPVAGLARAKATVMVTATVTSDPRPVGSIHIGPPTYAFDLDVTSVQTSTLRATVDVPVFVLASGTGWLGLLPGQHIIAHGRLEPSEPGELTAATMSASEPPQLIGRPPWAQRAAGSLRAGLQLACSALPGQVRGLLPGLIDGDTSRLDPAVQTAFQTTGMTHLVAVSGLGVG